MPRGRTRADRSRQDRARSIRSDGCYLVAAAGFFGFFAVFAAAAFLRPSVVCAPNFFVNRSTRPSVSISFCLPVKNGWQFEQISRCSSGFVDRVFHVAPHAQRASTLWYLGWIPSLTASSLPW